MAGFIQSPTYSKTARSDYKTITGATDNLPCAGRLKISVDRRQRYRKGAPATR